MNIQLSASSTSPSAHSGMAAFIQGFGFGTLLDNPGGGSRALESPLFPEPMREKLLEGLTAYGAALSDHDQVGDPVPAEKEHGPKRFQFTEEALQSTLDERFAMYEDAPPGWDGYSGLPLNKKSLIHAKQFLDHRPKGIRLPHPQLSTLGDVGLYWETDDLLVDITFSRMALSTITRGRNSGTERKEMEAMTVAMSASGLLKCRPS